MFRTLIINAAFSILYKYLISRIPYAPVKNWFEKMLDKLKKSADLLTDANPNNSEQFEEFWAENKEEIVGGTIDTLVEIITLEISDPDIVKILTELLKGLKDGEFLKKADTKATVTVNR